MLKSKNTLLLISILFISALLFGFSNQRIYSTSGQTSIPITSQENGKLPFTFDEDGTKVFELTAEPLTHEFAPGFNSGKNITVWGYNGKMPGPTIEVTEGDHVRINFTNKLTVPTTVHWHGLEVPNRMDGASGHTQDPVPPGGTYTYEFTVKQNGTFMYHSGHMGAQQVGMGLGGFFIAHPKQAYSPVVDHDFTMMLQIWNVPSGASEPDITAMNWNYFTMNGKVAPATLPFKVQKGDRVRVRLANLSMMSHPIHLHGMSFWVTGTDGGRIPDSAQWPAATISVNAGETRTIEFVAQEPGTWLFHCHFLHHIMNDMDRPTIPGQPMPMSPAQGMFTTVEISTKKNGEENVK